MKRIVVLLLMILLVRLTGSAQGFVEPPHEKAIINIVFDERLTGSSIRLYLDDSLTGSFVSNEYTSLVVEPGHHTFKAVNEDLALMEAEVAANRIYLVLVEGSYDDNAISIRFTPVKDGTPRFWRLKRLISASPPSPGNRDRGVKGKVQTFGEEVPAARISHLSKDMDVGRRHFEVPPISH